MAALPPVLGHYARIRVVILATGRTAVARVGGVSAVRRHVATAVRLGLEPLVLFPAKMKALGAEITGEIDGRAKCLAADMLADEAGNDDELAIVIAADWYVSPTAIIDFSERTRGPAVARFVDRGRVVAPLARITVATIRSIVPKLTDQPAAELIAGAAAADTLSVPLEVSERHRLSDNIAVTRCEAKLFGWVAKERRAWTVRFMQDSLAVPITRRLVNTRVSPAGVAAAKFALGIVAAAVMTHPSYLAGVVGASLYFASRVLDIISGDLSRAAVVEGARGEKADVFGDVAVLLTMVAALSLRSASLYAIHLAAAAATGILISTVVAYFRVFRRNWQLAYGASWRGGRKDRSRSDFVADFWKSNGIAYALIFAAATRRLDLFLWASAIAAHAYYVVWLISDARVRH